MKGKRLQFVVVSLMVFALLMAACSNKNEAGQSESSPTASNEGSSAGPAGQKSENPFEKKMKLTVFHSEAFNPVAPMPSRDDDAQRKILEDAVNIDLEWIIPPADQKQTKLNTLIASDDTPDLIAMGDRSSAVDYYNQEVIVSLNQYLDDYPNLKQRFTENQWNGVSYKGNVIGTPGYEAVTGIQGWWIRKDWLDKLQLQVPTTPEQLLEVMKAFTYNDPDGNNKNDTYGFITGIGNDGDLSTKNRLGWQQVFWMFGVVPNTVDLIDGKLVFDSVDDRMKEAVSFIHQMIEAKVVDPDWVSTDGAALGTKFNKGNAGVAVIDWRYSEPSWSAKMKELSEGNPEWIVIPPMVGPHGDQYSGFEAFQSNSWAISAKAAKDPDKVKRILAFLEFWYTNEDTQPYFSYGLKGIHWDMKDGKIVRLVPSEEDAKKYAYVANYFHPRHPNDPLYYNFQNPQTAENHKINIKYAKPNLVDAFLVPDSNDTQYTERQRYINETILSFMTGKEPISNWDKYVSTLENTFSFGKYREGVEKQLKESGIIQ